MKFGLAYATHPGIVPSVVCAEQLGYDIVHIYDTPLVFSEVFVVSGLVAARTSRIGIGISVVVPYLRLPHVVASGVGTLNEAAPGRVVVAFGTGFTGALSTGSAPDSWDTVREYVRVCRDLLSNRETEVVVKGRKRLIGHLHADLGYIDCRDAVPIFVSAAGPVGLDVAANVADGLYLMSAGERPVAASLRRTILAVRSQAAKYGRPPLATKLFTTMAIREPGEPSNSERLMGFVGPAVTQHFHADLGFGPSDPRTPPLLREATARYRARMRPQLRGDAPWIDNHRGHAIFVRDGEEDLLTPELIESVCQIGTSEELIEEITQLECAGVDELVWQVMPGHEAEVVRFAQEVMEPYRRGLKRR